MQWRLTTLALVLAATAVGEEKKDWERIEGTWTCVSRVFIGRKTPAEELKGSKVVFKGSTLTVSKGKERERFTYKLDPSARPRAIDLVSRARGKEKTLAIYELKGDTLKICWSEKVPEARPTRFACDADSGQTMIVLKRKKSTTPCPCPP
jgi:uncharacterized protein (TIGR03067 family)